MTAMPVVTSVPRRWVLVPLAVMYAAPASLWALDRGRAVVGVADWVFVPIVVAAIIAMFVETWALLVSASVIHRYAAQRTPFNFALIGAGSIALVLFALGVKDAVSTPIS